MPESHETNNNFPIIPNFPKELQIETITNTIKDFFPPGMMLTIEKFGGYIDIPERYYCAQFSIRLIGTSTPKQKYSFNFGDFTEHMRKTYAYKLCNFYQCRHTSNIIMESEITMFREGRYWKEHRSRLGYIQAVEYENDGTIVPGQDNMDQIDWNYIVPPR